MRLRTNELCPIHRSLSCCGREFLPKPKLVRLGVQRVEDRHHPRGYRELRSPAEMRKLMNRKVREQGGICAICHEDFTDYSDIVPYADVGIRNGMPTFRICRLDRLSNKNRRVQKAFGPAERLLCSRRIQKVSASPLPDAPIIQTRSAG